MASVADCIEKLVVAGKVTRAMADEALSFHKRSQAEFSLHAAPASADAAAALETAKHMRAVGLEKQLQASLAVRQMRENERRIAEDPRGRRFAAAGILTKDTAIGDPKLRALVKADPEHPIVRAGNIDYRGDVIRKNLMSTLGPAMEQLKSGIIPDMKKIQSAVNFIHDVFGDASGDPVSKALADGFAAMKKIGNDRAKAAGMSFKELDNWRFIQHWTPERVAMDRPEDYVAFYQKQISEGKLKLFDEETNKYATSARVPEILRKAYSDIKTGSGGAQPFSKEMRTFQYEPGKPGADGWLEANEKYGMGNRNILPAIYNHVDHMARSIALHEQLGPHPDAMFAHIMRLVKEDPGEGTKGMGFLTSPRALQLTYDTLAGKGHPVANQMTARIMSGLRDVVGVASLRNLPLTIAPGDTVMNLFSAQHLGMDGFKVLGELTKGGLSRDDARHLMVSAGSYMDFINNSYRRYEDEINANGMIRNFSRGIVKATGAEWWTRNGREGWSSSMLNQLGSLVDKPFDKLNDKTATNFLALHGITPADWDKIRAAPLFVADNGAKYIDPSKLGEDRVGERLLMAIRQQSSYAFHEPDARTQALMTQGTTAGSPAGEVWRSLGQYKQFTLERMSTHLMRVLTDGPMENRVARGAGFLALSMAAGAVSLQAAAVVSGKDPMDMASPKFWLQAFTKAGAGGLYGDMINAALFGGRDAASIAGQLAGPVPGFALDALGIATAPVRQELDPTGRLSPEQTMMNRAFQFGKRWSPSVWYAKAAVDRMIWDKLQTLTDPNYRQSFQRTINQTAKQGQGFWFGPGDSAPTRAPNMGTAIGLQ